LPPVSGSRPPTGHLIVVSNRLPVQVEVKGRSIEIRPSIGGLATSLQSVQDEHSQEMLWLGWPGVDLPAGKLQGKVERQLRETHDCIPVFIPKRPFDRYYYGFANRTLWPLFHYFPQFAHYVPAEWEAYRQVNQFFCDRLLQLARPGDTIWIHDYHLLLLPTLLRKKLPDSAIGLFLHIPFPSYEIFRILPWREELLRGMLGADLLGFHTFGFARHFLSSAVRLLGLEQAFGRLNYAGHQLQVDTFPLGVDVQRFASSADLLSVRRELNKLQHEVEGRKVILSVDRLDFTKGIPERLLAFERFLERHRRLRGRVTLVALCVPSRTRVPEYQALKRQIDELVGRINGRFGKPGWTPIWYMYRALPFEKLLPLYLLADVALVTPIRDGMNLVAKEYLASHPDGSGVLVLSETAGAAEELGEALIVNPNDQAAVVRALDQALNMPLGEQLRRNRPMLARLSRYDTRRWADDFLGQLQAARKAASLDQPQQLSGRLQDQMRSAYLSAKRRLLLLDYDGTLTQLVASPDLAAPDETLRRLLASLTEDPTNTLVVISGRDPAQLQSWLGDLNLNLVAEHGGQQRLADGRDWQPMVAGLDLRWKDQLRPLFEMFVDRTPGSMLEEKSAALAWHYRRAEPELGSLRAKELSENLEGFVANTPLHVLQGHKVIEVKPSEISKGRATQRWLADRAFDFVLAAGDDVTDEELFEALPERAWSVRLGRARHTAAHFTLPGPHELRRLLASLAEA
jgi:trehalose 6-phosphate synthase/phosphatase